MAEHSRPPRWRRPRDGAICLVAAVAGFVVCAGIVVASPKDHHAPVRAAVVRVADPPAQRPMVALRPVVDPPAAVWVTVRPGQCLWTIAAAHHVSWRALYAANRGRVGSDPSLIHAGLRLRIPSGGKQ